MPDFVGGNRIVLMRNGAEYFPALVGAIDEARREVFLESYIYADDQTGSLVTDALARAAARGVETRLLIDGFGAKDFAPRFRKALLEAGAEVMVFRPQVSPWPVWKQRGRLRRMHRKLASIDGRVAFVGGINIVDDIDDAFAPPRYDYAARIEGPLAGRVRAEAARLWTRVAWASLGRRWPGFDVLLRRSAPVATGASAVAGGQRAALVVRDSLRHRRDIEDAYLQQLRAARSEIFLANAYFFPTRRFRRALLDAARRDVSVTLLLQGKSDHPLLYYASRALYRSFLSAGIRIYEYIPSELHAKVGVFDGRVATVGSSNIDPFSLGLAREANVFVDDVEFAAALRASLHEALEREARPIPLNYWNRLGIGLRLRVWLAYRFARLVLTLYRLEALR